jgi:hypothetical protein
VEPPIAWSSSRTPPHRFLEMFHPIETVVVAEKEIELFSGQFLMCAECLIFIELG